MQMAGDGLLVALSYFLAYQLRFLDDPGTIPDRYVDLLIQSVGFVIVGKLVIFYLFGLYQKWWRFVGGRDIARIVQAVSVSSLLLIVLFTVIQPFPHDLPRSVAVTDFLLTLFLIAGARLGTRLFKERPTKGNRIARGREVLVVGAGSGGQMVVRELRLNPHLGETAIGFVDDNKDMRGMRIQGISVLGTTDEIETILDETEPDEHRHGRRTLPKDPRDRGHPGSSGRGPEPVVIPVAHGARVSRCVVRSPPQAAGGPRQDWVRQSIVPSRGGSLE